MKIETPLSPSSGNPDAGDVVPGSGGVRRARLVSGLSQTAFAALLGVSVRTLQDWEQGRREPSGAAKTLFLVAERYPEVLQELAT